MSSTKRLFADWAHEVFRDVSFSILGTKDVRTLGQIDDALTQVFAAAVAAQTGLLESHSQLEMEEPALNSKSKQEKPNVQALVQRSVALNFLSAKQVQSAGFCLFVGFCFFYLFFFPFRFFKTVQLC